MLAMSYEIVTGLTIPSINSSTGIALSVDMTLRSCGRFLDVNY